MDKIPVKLKEKITSDISAADLKLSLFNAALNSYRFDSVLKPYPDMFVNQTIKELDVNKLRLISDKIPSFKDLLEGSNLPDMEVLTEIYTLLHWLYLGCYNSPEVRNLDVAEMKKIQSLTQQEGETKTPDYIFEVIYGEEQERRFQSIKGDRKILYGYHGSKIENFHSILHHGLKGHLNKTSLFGSGTYLSSELSVSFIYSPSGSTWKNSVLGVGMSCIAVCEIIDDPGVRCHHSNKTVHTKSRASDSQSGDIPEKYYLVRNNEMLRVKYLLIYANKSRNFRNEVKQSWIRENRFLLLMISYLIILVAIGVAKSKSFLRLF